MTFTVNFVTFLRRAGVLTPRPFKFAISNFCYAVSSEVQSRKVKRNNKQHESVICVAYI